MSESESEPGPSQSAPSASQIEQGLRDIVARLFQTGKLDELTVKRVRRAAEAELGLAEDFLKSQEWSKKSKEIISDEVVRV